ncbi:methylated-DNA--[protein]-cysteine S-methyltransferase [Saccharothrix obliqua]|uniref:methylated-DNA--[protein]-cysteine S-methyltransferase n=1 Tax=Saccharothrix obliqua TaxID=2861747 RepID=UPI001C5EFC01|nr:methylated-DNA--[protein]-cysteine S-methyltransferase [Saccharothrix obliqua]MBW4717543.1 methylated-DNA--[protein]-cysteine S-methyltransferase [Saccharothrix obliqua]
MTNNGSDPVVAALGGLAATAPTGLLDRVVSRWVRVPGPVGDLYVAFGAQGISYVRTAASVDDSAVEFTRSFRDRFARPLVPGERPPAGLVAALRTGRTRQLRYDLRGLTPFEVDVLTAAGRIPAGQARPYAWVAREIGRPGAVRAVGTALGRNPVPVLIPCHRVTRADGQVGEYVFGTPVKEAMLLAEHVDLGELRELAKARVFYIGSDTTGIVCFPTCAHARRITPPHRRGFRTVDQATEAGYRPCLHCRPALAASA